MAATKRKTAPGSKAGRTAPRFGSPEWREKHAAGSTGTKPSTKKKPAKKKAK
jgi:hypothetical protein